MSYWKKGFLYKWMLNAQTKTFHTSQLQSSSKKDFLMFKISISWLVDTPVIVKVRTFVSVIGQFQTCKIMSIQTEQICTVNNIMGIYSIQSTLLIWGTGKRRKENTKKITDKVLILKLTLYLIRRIYRLTHCQEKENRIS